MPSEKQLKAATKEGGKKGQDLAGMRDMGGVKFFSVAVDSANGNWELMEAIMNGMNKEVDPEADDRKGGAGDIGKTILFADEKILIIMCHVPTALSSLLDQNEWFNAIIEAAGAEKVGEPIILPNDGGTILKAEMKAEADREKFPLKARDVGIGRSYEYLVKKGLVRPESDDESVEMEEDIEW